MPQIFRAGEYCIFFWTNEGYPNEPIHVHISKGIPNKHATKVWITENGNCLLCHNDSDIPEHVLRNIMRMVEARSESIKKMWTEYFGSISYYC